MEKHTPVYTGNIPMEQDRKVRLIWKTDNAERILAFCARVSSDNQENPEIEGLIRYMIRNAHWSPFEMVSMCLEIETTRAISAQIIRHRSFSFQEFSQRYSPISRVPRISPDGFRLKGKGKRSGGEIIHSLSEPFAEEANEIIGKCYDLYSRMIGEGVSPETARYVLPMMSNTKLYMMGTLRSWIHYVEVRTHETAQKEHRELALEAKAIIKKEFPVVYRALGWELP